MNSFSIYLLLVIIYLGVSRIFSIGEDPTSKLKNLRQLSQEFDQSPLSIILLESQESGIFIKTYIQKFLVVHPESTPKIISKRVEKNLSEKLKMFKGMSILRREQKTRSVSTLPMPPGQVLIGNVKYGKWVIKENVKLWSFHKKYSFLPEVYGWSNFVPTYEYYRRSFVYLANERPYFGEHGEFGTQGKISRNQISLYKKNRPKGNKSFGSILKDVLINNLYWDHVIEQDEKSYE